MTCCGLTPFETVFDALAFLVVDGELLVGDEELVARFLTRSDHSLGMVALASITEGHA